MNSRVTQALALLLIALALLGTGTGYKLSLDSRLDGLEQKIQQQNVTLQQFQASLDAFSSSRTEALSGVNDHLGSLAKEIDALQTSFAPLGKSTQEQKDILAQLHQQVTKLEQSESDQSDAQHRLADHLAELERNPPAPAATLSPASTSAHVPASVPISTPISTLQSLPAHIPPLVPIAPKKASASAFPNAAPVPFPASELPLPLPLPLPAIVAEHDDDSTGTDQEGTDLTSPGMVAERSARTHEVAAAAPRSGRASLESPTAAQFYAPGVTPP